MKAELIELWHASRTALSGRDSSRWARMVWVRKEYLRRHPEASPKEVWLEIGDIID